MRSGWTLGRALALLLVGLVVLSGSLFSFLLQGWQRSLLESARAAGAKQGEGIARQIEASLYLAEKVLDAVETRIQVAAVRVDDLPAFESDLYASVLSNPELSEVSFTRAGLPAEGSGGRDGLVPSASWQLSVFRASREEGGALSTRRTFRERGGYVSEVRTRSSPGVPGPAPFTPQGPAPDPAAHPTFVTTTSSRFYGQAIWTSLHYSELDSHLPEASRRVAVDVMKAVESADGGFLGVLRVGLLTRRIDELIAAENERNAPHRVFLCDPEGRLIARGVPSDVLREEPDDELRIPPLGIPAEIAL